MEKKYLNGTNLSSETINMGRTIDTVSVREKLSTRNSVFKISAKVEIESAHCQTKVKYEQLLTANVP